MKLLSRMLRVSEGELSRRTLAQRHELEKTFAPYTCSCHCCVASTSGENVYWDDLFRSNVSVPMPAAEANVPMERSRTNANETVSYAKKHRRC